MVERQALADKYDQERARHQNRISPLTPGTMRNAGLPDIAQVGCLGPCPGAAAVEHRITKRE